MGGALRPDGSLHVGQGLGVVGRRVDRRRHAVGLLAAVDLLLGEAHLGAGGVLCGARHICSRVFTFCDIIHATLTDRTHRIRVSVESIGARAHQLRFVIVKRVRAIGVNLLSRVTSLMRLV